MELVERRGFCPGKKRGRSIDREFNDATFLLRCLQIGLTLNELDLVTIGMVNDMFVERSNDENSDMYQELASQEDFDNFCKH